jgi:hypothetical protein
MLGLGAELSTRARSEIDVADQFIDAPSQSTKKRRFALED